MTPIGLSIGDDLWELPQSYFAELHTAGIEHVEVSLTRGDTPPERLADACEYLLSKGFSLWSLHVPFGGSWDISSADEALRLRTLARMELCLDVAQAFRIGRAVVHPSTEPIADDARQAHKRAFCKSLPALCDMGEKRGVTIAVENLPRTCLLNCADEALELLAADSRARLCFDVNHLLKEPAVSFAKALAGRIETLHISDYDGIDERHWLPGEGIIPFAELFKTLRAGGYRGVYMLEVRGYADGRAYSPKEAADSLRRYL